MGISCVSSWSLFLFIYRDTLMSKRDIWDFPRIIMITFSIYILSLYDELTSIGDFPLIFVITFSIYILSLYDELTRFLGFHAHHRDHIFYLYTESLWWINDIFGFPAHHHDHLFSWYTESLWWVNEIFGFPTHHRDPIFFLRWLSYTFNILSKSIFKL